MHSTETNTIIGTQESVYGDSPAGKLEESILVRSMQFPHQQGFNGNSQTGFPVAVYSLSATALEKGVVAGGVSAFSHSTAMAAPLGGVICVHEREIDVLIKAPALKVLPEQRERHPKNFFVEFPAFWLEQLEILNTGAGIVFNCKIRNVPDHLTHPIFDKVSFPALEPSKTFLCSMASLISKALQSFPPLKNLFSFNPDVFSIVALFENPAFRSKDGRGKTLAIDINADNISFVGNSLLFGKESGNLSISGEPVGFTSPAGSEEAAVSLIVPILYDWNCSALPGIQSEFDKKPAFRGENLAIPWNVEFDCDGVHGSSFRPNYASFNVTYHLAVERGGFLAG